LASPHRLKKQLLVATGFLAGFQLHGQGTVNFSNVGLNAPVIDALTCAPAVGGTTFSVALYWAPVDPLNPTVQPFPWAFTAQGPTTHVGILIPLTGQYLPGLYAAGTVFIPGIKPPGSMGWFQVKVWQSAYGNTFEQAVANPGAEFGLSNIILIPTGDPTAIPPTPQTQLTGISPILIPLPIGFPPCVPEPSALVLAFCGTAILLFSASRHRNS
jgi:hypothetical protein